MVVPMADQIDGGRACPQFPRHLKFSVEAKLGAAACRPVAVWKVAKTFRNRTSTSQAS